MGFLPRPKGRGYLRSRLSGESCPPDSVWTAPFRRKLSIGQCSDCAFQASAVIQTAYQMGFLPRPKGRGYLRSRLSGESCPPDSIGPRLSGESCPPDSIGPRLSGESYPPDNVRITPFRRKLSIGQRPDRAFQAKAVLRTASGLHLSSDSCHSISIQTTLFR